MALNYILDPTEQYVNINGKPLVGGFLTVYIHGQTRPYITYKDFTGDLNKKNVTLDMRGMCVIIGEDTNTYDIHCYDADNVQQWSRENVPTMGSGGGGGTGITYSGIAPVVVNNDSHEISVEHKELKVASPITFDTDTATLGFDGSAYETKAELAEDCYTKTEVDEKDTNLSNRIASNETAIATNVTNIAELKSTSDGYRQELDEDKNNIQTLNENFGNYYDKSQIDGFLKNWSGFIIVPYGEELPAASEASLGKIYLWKRSETKTDPYEEWVSDGTAWSQIGEMSIDLTPYLKSADAATTYETKVDHSASVTELQTAIDAKLSSVAVDGSTVTGDGTTENPLVAHASEPDSYTLVQGTYVKLVDDTTNKTTTIDDSLIKPIVTTVNSLGYEVSGLSSAIGGKLNIPTIVSLSPDMVTWSASEGRVEKDVTTITVPSGGIVDISVNADIQNNGNNDGYYYGLYLDIYNGTTKLIDIYVSGPRLPSETEGNLAVQDAPIATRFVWQNDTDEEVTYTLRAKNSTTPETGYSLYLRDIKIMGLIYDI